MTRPEVHGFFDEVTFTVTYVVVDPETRNAAIIDPVLDYDFRSGRTGTDSADKVLAFVKEQGLTVPWILDTHVHADHMTGAAHVKEQLGAPTGIGRHVCTVQETFRKLYNIPDLATDGSQFDRLFEDGDTFTIGTLEAHVMHTPGHTPACLTYVIGDAAFCGDTLFMPDYGSARCDFPGGDARTLFRSNRRILSLDPATRIFVGHDYMPNGRPVAWETTVAEERADNIHVNDSVSEDDFVAMREARDATLNMPNLILPSLQVNLRNGAFPPPEDNGVSYLKIPLNAV